MAFVILGIHNWGSIGKRSSPATWIVSLCNCFEFVCFECMNPESQLLRGLLISLQNAWAVWLGLNLGKQLLFSLSPQHQGWHPELKAVECARSRHRDLRVLRSFRVCCEVSGLMFLCCFLQWISSGGVEQASTVLRVWFSPVMVVFMIHATHNSITMRMRLSLTFYPLVV